MRQPGNPSSLPTQASAEWARDRLQDVLFGCELNWKLKRAGLCPKYIFEMSDVEYRQYCLILDDLLFKR